MRLALLLSLASLTLVGQIAVTSIATYTPPPAPTPTPDRGWQIEADAERAQQCWAGWRWQRVGC